MDESELAFGRVLFSVPVLWIFAFIDGIPYVDKNILYVFLFSLPLEVVALILYIRAIKISPLSVTVPFLSFTPVFLLVTSPIMLGEIPSYNGIAGIFMIVFGAYIINLNAKDKGWLYPFKMIFAEKGSVLMLITAFIYSITSNFGKMGVLLSSPAFYAASYLSLLSALLFCVLKKRDKRVIVFKREFIVIGLLSSIMITFHMIAIKMILVSYMISIKRSSLLFSIIFASLFLNEKHIKYKIIGGILMITGIAILALYK